MGTFLNGTEWTVAIDNRFTIICKTKREAFQKARSATKASAGGHYVATVFDPRSVHVATFEFHK